MATKISALTEYEVYHGNDVTLVVDVHDLAMAPSGTDKKVTWEQIMAGAVFGPSGDQHAPGTVPDPGPLASSNRYLCEDGTWAVPPGAGSPSHPIVPPGDGGGGGGLASVSVANANGFGGDTATDPSGNAVISIEMYPIGILKGDGAGVSAAVPGTDYVTPSGSITGSAGTITGTIATSQVADLASWTGSPALVTLGTIGTGTWQGTPIARAYLDPTLVSSSGSYVDPAWVASLAGTKVTGNIAGSAGGLTANIAESQVTNLVPDLAGKAADSSVVHLAGNETIGGTKTFSSTIAGAVTNGVVTTGNYADPAWITSLANAKITGLAASATTDATNAANIGSGTLPVARIGASSLAYGKIQQAAASTILGNPVAAPATLLELTLRPNLAFFGTSIGSRVPLCWVIAPGTAIVNTQGQASLFTGATLGGTLTIPANALLVGSMLRFELFGTYGQGTGSPTYNFQVSLGGTVIVQGTSTGSASTVSGSGWSFDHSYGPGILVQATGVAGKLIGLDSANMIGSTRVGLNASGTLNAAPAQVTINTGIAQVLDIKFQWGALNVANTIQLLGGCVYLDY